MGKRDLSEEDRDQVMRATGMVKIIARSLMANLSAEGVLIFLVTCACHWARDFDISPNRVRELLDATIEKQDRLYRKKAEKAS